MIDLLILVILSWQLHRLAVKKGVAPMPYVLNFAGSYFTLMIVMSFILVAVYGKDVLTTEEGVKKIAMVTPFAMMFEFLLFVFFRRKIDRIHPVDEEDDHDHPGPDSEKKDLSYFR